MSVYIGLAIQLLKEGAEVRVVKVSRSHEDVLVWCEVDAKNESDYIDRMPLMRWNKERTKLDLSEDLGIVYHVCASYLFNSDTGAQRSANAPAARLRTTPGAPFSLIDAMNRRRSSQAIEELVRIRQPFQEGRAAAWNLPFSSSPMVVFGVCHILSSDGKPRNLTAATPPSRSLPELWVHDRRRVAFI